MWLPLQRLTVFCTSPARRRRRRLLILPCIQLACFTKHRLAMFSTYTSKMHSIHSHSRLLCRSHFSAGVLDFAAVLYSANHSSLHYCPLLLCRSSSSLPQPLLIALTPSHCRSPSRCRGHLLRRSHPLYRRPSHCRRPLVSGIIFADAGLSIIAALSSTAILSFAVASPYRRPLLAVGLYTAAAVSFAAIHVFAAALRFMYSGRNLGQCYR